MTDRPAEADLDAAEASLGYRLPPDYRAFLSRENGREWFVDDATFVQLYDLATLLSLHPVTRGNLGRLHPGLLAIGGDGSAEVLGYDMRTAEPPLVLVNVASQGWSECFRQGASITEFLERVATQGWDFVTPYLAS